MRCSSGGPRRCGRLARAGGAALLLAVLGGCALLAPQGQREAAYGEFLEARGALEAWSVAGRAALRDAGEAVTLSLRWRQRAPGRYTLALSGPFGSGSVRIRGRPGQVALEEGGGRRFTAESPEALVAARTGYEVPVTALRDWIVGRPAAGLELEARELDGEGRPARLVQGGWRVTYHGWQTVEGIDMPTRFEVHRGAKALRVALRGWSLGHGE